LVAGLYRKSDPKLANSPHAAAVRLPPGPRPRAPGGHAQRRCAPRTGSRSLRVAAQYPLRMPIEPFIFACEYPRHSVIAQEARVILYGFGPLLWAGTLQTIELSVLSLAAAVARGLAGAAAKLSRKRSLRTLATGYTTLIRSVPDLVLMLLLFYSIQIAVNHVTEAFDWPQLDIDPFVAGVLTLGFIYGAYFTETFRGAFLAVPRGQLEAGGAYGMNGLRVFARILFPQMMRFALPGIGNNWQVLVKATALVSIIGLADVVKAAQDAGKSTFNMFFFVLVAALIYLALTSVSNLLLIALERRYSIGVRHAEL
jgi:histidine transport system permease protein